MVVQTSGMRSILADSEGGKNMSRKEFQPAEMNIIQFDVEDVLTTSGVEIIDRPPDDGNEDIF